MGKVKLTKEQAAGVESIKNTIHENIKELTVFPSRYYEEQRPLSELEVAVIEEAVFHGYEVEETFEAGDWVSSDYHDLVGQVVALECDGWLRIEDSKSARLSIAHSKHFKHATKREEEKAKRIKFFIKNNREDWELKHEDIIYHTGIQEYFFIDDIDGGLLHLYAISGGEFYQYKIEEIKENFIVVCFAKDRKDIKEAKEC